MRSWIGLVPDGCDESPKQTQNDKMLFAEAANATNIAKTVIRSVHQMQGVAVPGDLTATITGKYGETSET